MCSVRLNYCDWPIADQNMWTGLTTQASPLDPGGELLSLRPITIQSHLVGYERWLYWLQQLDPLALSIDPISRITAERVAGWLSSMATLAPYSRKKFLDDLIRIVVAAAPDNDILFLRRMQRKLLALAQNDNGSRKIGRIPSTLDVIAAALSYEQTADDLPEHSLKRARVLRDAAMLAFLTTIPMRRKNFAELALCRTIWISNASIRVTVWSHETKNHRPFEMDLVGPAVPLLHRYVSEARDVLASGNDNRADELWLADTGKPYAFGYLCSRIKDLSNRLLGMPVAIHFFRDGVTTSLVRASTELAHAPKAILGHSDFRTSERHYNQATAIETGRSFGDMLKQMQKGE